MEETKHCDILLSEHKTRDGISRVHFRIDFNWDTGCLILFDQSSHGTIVESVAMGRKELHKNSIPIFSNDIIQAGLIRFQVVIPSHEDCESAYDQNWQAYKRDVMASLPQLGSLDIQRNPLVTMKESGKLSLLMDEEDPDTTVKKAVDDRGNFYAIKCQAGRKTRRKADDPRIMSTFVPERSRMMSWPKSVSMYAGSEVPGGLLPEEELD